ncbi:MAG TPA: pyridoxamine 5'-phosphate oxidase [Steroidobacteraceae bacterium]|jgi:pyridoxamine 5'-phosphate oxidase|nr:pyridoxamine 5'-phosphate oxidase [Steroidobacteraceae bacterium]
MALYQEYLPDPLPAEPLALAAAWLDQAVREAAQANPNAMVLATADQHGQPSARIVLCKEIRPQPGYLSFFSNYESRKGTELAANPRAAAVLHWDQLRRQVRIEGPVTLAAAAASDAYFASRAWQSRIGAWASRQSVSVPSRAALAAAVDRTARRFGVPSPLQSADDAPDPGVAIPRPPHWGGYQLWAEAVELWVEGAARLHDRARWTRTLEPGTDGFNAGGWSVTRLQP